MRSLKKVAVSVAAATAIFASVGIFVAPVHAQNRFLPPGAPAQGFADLAERLLPAVVNISTTTLVQRPQAQQQQPPGQRRGPDMPQFPPGSPFEEFFRDFGRGGPGQDQTPRRGQSLGSGFIIDFPDQGPKGAGYYVVTNNHVIDGAEEIKVLLHDNTTLPAKLVGKDPKTDLAVLRIESDKPLATVKWGNSDQARIGDWVLAIGNPFGLGGTVTAGILSARSRELAGPYDDFLQTDASINKGNSGGPLFNLNGDVIGVNTAIYSPTGGSIGIGFSVSSLLAKPVIEQLKEFGRTKRGWLGVNIQSVTDEIAESLGLGKARGALVARVTERGPAEQAGIQSRDVIIRFDNKEVTEMKRLPRIVAETQVGKAVKVEVWRGDKILTFDITLGELEENEQQAAAPAAPQRPRPGQPQDTVVAALGMSLAPLTQELREKYGVAEQTRGVVVTKVEDGSTAAERGVREGDVIVEVQQEGVSQPSQVVQKVQDARKQNRRSVLVVVERQGQQRFVGLPIGPG
jgi:serine protease Do